MAAPRVATATLALAMLCAGTINTVVTKFQDLTPVPSPDGRPAYFYHPALQSAAMFLGEALCLVGAAVSAARRRRRRRGTAGSALGGSSAPSARPTKAAVLAFALPAVCDAAATTALNAGLSLSTASSFQMLRGTLVAWAGLFTQVILRRRLRPHHWFGVVLIAAGAAVVGAASIVFEGGGSGSGRHVMTAPADSTPPAAALGVSLVVGSQALTALQFIAEEALLSKHRVPALTAVGLEGVWGLALCAAALPVLSRPLPRPGGGGGPAALPIDDAWAGLRQVAASPRLAVSMAVTVASIAAFNACGLAVTKRLSGAGRAATDACRTLAVWCVALGLGWETFVPGGWLKVFGFALLLSGSALFNGLVRACLPRVASVVEADAEAAAAEAPLLVDDGGGGGGAAAAAAAAPLSSPAPPAVPPLPPRRAAAAPLAAARPPGRHAASAHYTLARSMRLLPAALSPHSLLDPTPAGLSSLAASDSGSLALGGGGNGDSEAEASGHGGGGAREALLRRG